ncbi:hypothetical protein PUNSTDRAFT_134386 [Punctularia strigosozonata HHB-11173 SS5]|uniref:uncharacterized protein n=1 Tax=Punctularia strigosozonata (strain HHB-11173) TaxID=741275 RepID=UPI0004417B0A|nr:uncharacterized protein PUNSTDRAFT_134386 [Punctularia strigosozonata HHB-11173 SS5]EIN09223.1 hypothetical protein PUNSTDRAFT_134386 [Punctularia strigosozonata HHB-11173 SS5]
MPFPPQESKLVSIFCQSVLYGAYTMLFVLTTWMLITRRPLRKPMLFVSTLMWVVATMHVATNFTRIIKAFITFSDAPGGPAAFFNRFSEFTQMFGSTLYVLQTLIGDSMVLYRCYLAWERKFTVIAFPLLCLFGSTATGIGILYSFDRVNPEANIFVHQLSQWITAFFSMTFATNVLCTVLVAFRVYRLNRKQLIGARARHLRPLLLIVVESGAVYSAWLMALLILYNTDSWFQYVVLDSVSPIVGIVFSVIILRIAIGVTSEEGETALLGSPGGQLFSMGRLPSRGGTHQPKTGDEDASV